MHLVAPQYSDGLDLYIFPYKIQGGGLNGQHLNEINNLNHYIGMKPIQAADFMEMRWMPFVFGLIILMTLRSVVFGEMSNVVDLFALYSYFGVFSIGSFWYRLYEYGHNLDPHAPVHIKPFTPMLIGVKQIANFREASYPMAGAYLLCLSVLLILMAGWFSRKEQRMSIRGAHASRAGEGVASRTFLEWISRQQVRIVRRARQHANACAPGFSRSRFA